MTSSYLRNVESESVSIFFQEYELQGKLFQNKFDFAIKVVCVLFFIQTTTTKARVSKDKNHFFHGPNVEEWANHE